jgi:hypothetical protein
VEAVGGTSQTYPEVLFSEPEQWDWQGIQPQPLDGNGEFVRGFTTGTTKHVYPPYEGVAFEADSRDEGTLKFRVPAHYRRETAVIFTLEGATYVTTNEVADLGQVKLRWNDEWRTPVGWDNEARTVSYILLVDGAATVTLDGASFDWPSIIDADTGDGGLHSMHQLSFSGFHNAEVTMQMVTPSGDPVKAPVDSGDGENEFTFSSDNPGVLTINLKANVASGGGADKIKDDCYFTVGVIAGSTMAWDPANPNGKPTASGNDLLATVRFTGLPANNSAFGPKKAAICYKGKKQDEKVYEVFFLKNEKNHPSNQSSRDWPNWMYYWLQTVTPLGSPTPTFKYSSSSVSEFAGGTTEITLGYEAPGAGVAPYVADNPLEGIDLFAWTVRHESQHFKDWCDLWSNDYLDWFNNHKGKSGPNDDKDGDRIPNEIEDANLNGTYDAGDLYDWQNYNTPTANRPSAIKNDFEDWGCQRNKNVKGDHSKDWSDPGMQHKTKDNYDD